MQDQRNKDLAKIHIAIKQLGLDDATYREMLKNLAGVESAADLTAAGRAKVLAHLYKAGFSGRKARRYPGRPKIERLFDKAAMLKKIEAHLAESRRPWAYVHAMAKRMFKIERVQWCKPDQLHKIIAALEYDARRHGRYAGQP